MRNYASLHQSLLRDLCLLDNQVDLPITSDIDVSLVARVALAGSFYKKLSVDGNSVIADTAALKKFKAINIRVSQEPLEFPVTNEAESCFYDYFKDNLRLSLQDPAPAGSSNHNSFDLEYIRNHMDVGPGAAQKADSRSMVTKLFQSPLSYSDDYILSVYRSALAIPGPWADAEMRRFHRYGNVKVEGGKLFFAAKNAEISRVCCTEPSVEMLIQKAVGAFLEERLESYFGINLGTQPDFNRKLARIGSLDGSFGTIDLVSASDSIGLNLVMRDFPDGFLKSILKLSRSKKVVYPDGSKDELHMISTMGNGFTFPLQTIIFASAVLAVYQVMGLPTLINGLKQYSVFGDDIIVRESAYEFVIKMLNKLGFEVNVRKSFNYGKFRESCGHDYMNGCDVRGVYIKSLETPQEVYSAFNRLASWSAKHGIWLPETLALLKSWVRDIRIPLEESIDSGFHVPFKLSRPKVDARYWFQYRAYQRRVLKLDVNEEANGDLSNSEDAFGFLRGIYRRRDVLLETDQDRSWQHDQSVSVPIRDGIGVKPRYKIVTRSVPYWDYLPSHLTKDRKSVV